MLLGNSVREESFTSGGLQRFDTMKVARGRRTISGGSTTSADATIDICLQHTTSLSRNVPLASDNITPPHLTKTFDPLIHTIPCGKVLLANSPCRDKTFNRSTDTNTRLCNPVVKTNVYNLKSFSDDTAIATSKKTGAWYIFKCSKKNEKHCPISSAKTRLTVENETQTDLVPYNLCDSFTENDRGNIEDELTSYMEELYRRQKRCKMT